MDKITKNTDSDLFVLLWLSETKIFQNKKNPNITSPPAVAGQLPGGSQSKVVPGPLEGAQLVVDHAVQPHLTTLHHGDVLGLVQELLLASSDHQQDGGEH